MEYLTLFRQAKVTEESEKRLELEAICSISTYHKERYDAVTQGTKRYCGSGVPWMLVACIHSRESNHNFGRHLHNGDPLSARTTHVPIGRPTYGNPPFKWEESAIDAFSGRWMPKTWDLSSSLCFLEHYNGFGYRHHNVNSPYLWACTDQYASGLFTADGKFDEHKKDSRPGCVAILKTFAARGFSLDFTNESAQNFRLH